MSRSRQAWSGIMVRVAIGMAILVTRSVFAGDGPVNTPLSAFTDGKPARHVWTVPGVIKRNNFSTDFICTSLEATGVSADIGVEIFDNAGNQLNSVGNGASACAANNFPAGFKNVPAGSTVTIGITGTVQLLEDCVLALGTVEGSARIVSTSSRISCNAIVLDTKHMVQDPAICPTCPPPPVTSLKVIKAKKQSGD